MLTKNEVIRTSILKKKTSEIKVNNFVKTTIPETNNNEIAINCDQEEEKGVILKITNQLENINVKKENNDDLKNITYENLKKESKIRQKIVGIGIKINVITIISLIIVVPFLDNNWQFENKNYFTLSNYIDNFYLNRQNNNSTISDLFFKNIEYQTDPLFPVVNITFNNSLIYDNISMGNYNYRKNEIKFVQNDFGLSKITYCCKTENEYISIINIVRFVIVGIFILISTTVFENDAKTIVVEPLEIMIEIVQRVANDPMNAKNVDYLQNGMKSLLSKTNKSKKKLKILEKNKNSQIKIIHTAIIKISALLASGFGEAGCEIIKENITSNQGLNPMLVGKKKMAIFGFCDIRNFTDVNIALQEKTMVFVNEVADIVHSCVDKFGGAANKNIGDAFLCAWKFNDNDYEFDGKDLIINKQSKNVRFIADQALLGFLSILIKINKDKKIISYRKNIEILAKISNFKVKMGFGLQIGWAIEGAIGSSFKIDASYLSPFVNMAARLEAATNQYGVSILIGGDLFDLLSNELKDICRQIDIVYVKGSENPLSLYTIDVNLNIKQSNKDKIEYNLKEKRNIYNRKKEKLIDGIQSEGSIGKYILKKKSFQDLLNTKKSSYFYLPFKEGLDNYIKGNWTEAKEKFNECLFLDKNDGPTNTLMRYMKRFNFITDDNWDGVRQLEKR